MKKTHFTFYTKLTRPLIMVFGLLLLNFGVSQAQCSLGCNYSINVSLDTEDCEATISPADLLTDSTTCPGGVFIVELRHNGTLIPQNPTITAEFVGKTLEAKVIDTRPLPDGGNNCWGYITVEDYLAPIIDCTPPDTAFLCYEAASFTPEVEDNCGSFTLYTLDSLVITNDCSGNLPDSLLQRVTKTYKAIDLSGNESAVCTISYDVKKLDSLEIIVAPKNYLYPVSALMCDENFPTTPEGNPSPERTGYPQLNNKDLKPGSFLACNLLVSFKDEVLKDANCIKKIGRTWRIMEWSCNAPAPREILQMIEIADNNDPVITGLQDITVSTTPHHCDALATLPAATVSDVCSAVTVTISGGTPLVVGNGGVTSLPVGVNVVTYVATDGCGNTTTAQINVTVEDLTPPVPVCDQNTTISVTTDGLAWVPASVFDDGSYDECALAKMLVRRMGDDVCDSGAPQFDDFISLGEYNNHYYVLSKHKIESRLANKHGVAIGGYLNIANSAERTWINNAIGNINDTLGYLSQASLTSKPFFVDIANGGGIVTNLDPNGKYNYVIEINKIAGESLWSSYAKFCCEDDDVMVAFRVVDRACNYNDCMVNVEVQDKIAPSITCPADLVIDCDEYYPTGVLIDDFGPYVITDNCDNPTVNDRITSNSVNQCNVGDLRRTITATDKDGRSATCVQEIEILGKTYDPTRIRYPADKTFDSCANPDSTLFDPVNTNGYPVFLDDDQCNLLGADYEDFVYTFNNTNGEACFKIVRRWTVIDWCTKYGNTFTTYPPYDQIIKVNDSTKPEITSSCAPKSTCTYDATCTDGFIELTATATDVCTDILDYFYQIDVNNDGKYDTGNYKGQPLVKNGKANMINASGTYPIGTHKIQYTFADKCGNVTTCEQVFTIVNCKAPTPYCLNGLAVDLMPVDEDNDGEIDGGMVALWANDFDAGSFHSCAGYEVLVSFSENVLDTGRVFTCDDFGRTDVMIFASIITPMNDTIHSFCNTYVDIQDNMGACSIMRVGVSGRIATNDARNLSDAEVILQGSETSIVTSNVDGEYTFGDMPIGGNYNLYPSKNNDPMNGVSTLDLVLIQRHILSIAELTNAHDFIAADVNKDARITASDLVELRKLILGVSSEFSNNNSWRFLDAATIFPAGEYPLDVKFNESYTIDQLNSDMVVDFTSIKVGDVNGSVKTNVRSNNSEPRSANDLEIFTNNVKFAVGEEITVPLTVENESLMGAQFTVNFDASKFTFTGIEDGELNVSEDNFGMSYLNEGRITFSWNTSSEINVNELFKLKFVALIEGELDNNIAITSDITNAEAYDINNDVMDVTFRTKGGNNGLALYQNIPNPFTNNTMISFNMPSKGQANLSILDVTGKIVYSNTNSYEAGVNNVTINRNDLNLSGIMYYQLTVNNETLVKKMVVIE